jgi:hypothetical protein
MVMFDKNATFVKSRVVGIYKKTNTDYLNSNYAIDPIGFYNLDTKPNKEKMVFMVIQAT